MWAFLGNSRNAPRPVNYNTIGLVKWIDVDGARHCSPTEAQGSVHHPLPGFYGLRKNGFEELCPSGGFLSPNTLRVLIR